MIRINFKLQYMLKRLETVVILNNHFKIENISQEMKMKMNGCYDGD